MASSTLFTESARSSGASHDRPNTKHPTTGGLRLPAASVARRESDVLLRPSEEDAPHNTEQGVTDLEELQPTIETGLTPEHAAAQKQTTEVQPQSVLPTTPASDTRYRTRSLTGSLGISTARHQELAPAAPKATVSVHHDPAQGSASGPPIKRKPGRPRKHPLPPPPREPTPNPAADLGRQELTRIIAGVRDGRDANDDQYGQYHQCQPVPDARSIPTAAETAEHSPANVTRPSGVLAPERFSPLLQSHLPALGAAFSPPQHYAHCSLVDSGQLPATTTASVPVEAFGQFRAASPLQWRPNAPGTTSPLHYDQLSPIAPTQLFATTAAPATTKAPFQSPADAPTLAQIHRHLQCAADPQTWGDPHVNDYSQVTATPAMAPQSQQLSQANSLAPPGPSVQQRSSVIHPPQPARQPREPEEVFAVPQPGSTQATLHAVNLIQQRLAQEIHLRNSRKVAAINLRRREERLGLDLAGVYQFYNPPSAAVHPGAQYDHAPLENTILSIFPSVGVYPIKKNSAWLAEPSVACQPQFPPHSHPLFPFNAYWGRNLNEGPVLPTMTISGGPKMPCFRRSWPEDRTDLGFGPGIRIADEFRWIAAKYEKEHKKAMLDYDRAMFGMRG